MCKDGTMALYCRGGWAAFVRRFFGSKREPGRLAMRVLFVQPRCADAVDLEYVSLQFPINLGYLAATLRQAGHDVRLVDENVQPHALLLSALASFAPEMVGLTAMTANYPVAARLVREIRRILPRAVIALGGAHATALPEEVLGELPELDFVVVGEGEATVVELAQRIADQGDFATVRGIAWRAGARIRCNATRPFIEDLDSLPFPARDLIPLSSYDRQHASRGFPRRSRRIAEIVTSRGCPHHCIFCASHLCTGRALRARSVPNVIAEVDECMALFGIEHLSIEDDAFTYLRDNALVLCDHFAARGLTWNCNARVDNVDLALLQKAAASGCLKVSFGVESGSPPILAKTGKGVTVEQVRTAVRAARAAGIRFVECTFLLGAHPDETVADIAATEALIAELGADLTSVCVTCPYPGTAFERLLRQRGLLPAERNWAEHVLFGDVRPYERLTHLTRAELWHHQRRILRRFYGSPRYILSQLRKLRNWEEAWYFARLGAVFVREFLLPQGRRRAGGAHEG
jgi:anaerobic magnesium-protoporphyrin IX monomethyl ester cyclase